MKKLFTCILTIIILSLAPATVFAEGTKDYSIPKYGIQIQFSSEWTVATKENIPDIAAYDGVKKMQASVTQNINDGIYDLYAIHFPSVQRFVSVARNQQLEDESLSDAENIAFLYESLKDDTSINILELCKTTTEAFVVFESGPTIRAISYSNGTAICFDYNVVNISIDNTIRTDFKNILDSVQFPPKKGSTTNATSSQKQSDASEKSSDNQKTVSSSKEDSSTISNSSTTSTLSSTNIKTSDQELTSPNSQVTVDSFKLSSVLIPVTIVLGVILLITVAIVTITIIRKKKP